MRNVILGVVGVVVVFFLVLGLPDIIRYLRISRM
jgi:hypothetical protein